MLDKNHHITDSCMIRPVYTGDYRAVHFKFSKKYYSKHSWEALSDLPQDAEFQPKSCRPARKPLSVPQWRHAPCMLYLKLNSIYRPWKSNCVSRKGPLVAKIFRTVGKVSKTMFKEGFLNSNITYNELQTDVTDSKLFLNPDR